MKAQFDESLSATTDAQTLKGIGDQKQAATAHLLKLKDEMATLKDAGIFAAVPGESWEDKDKDPDGEKEYLYLLFRTGKNGNYLGPDGKRRLAVGKDPDNIASARAKVDRTQKFLELAERVRALESWISNLSSEITLLARRAANWPK